jgi:surface-anchored protein
MVVPRASYELSEELGGAPDSAAWAFLGVDSGEAFWLLPQSPRQGMPWFGASTEGVPRGLYEGDQLTFAITQIDLPSGASLSAWSSDTFGAPAPIFSTADGLTEHVFSVGAHVHFNWAFTQSGQYAITFAISGLRDGAVQASLPQILRVEVLP